MPIKYLTHTELERFFAGVDAPRDRAVFGVIYHYGLRVSEATLIRLHDVDFTRCRIGGAPRSKQCKTQAEKEYEYVPCHVGPQYLVLKNCSS